jgi:hypothetical protein
LRSFENGAKASSFPYEKGPYLGVLSPIRDEGRNVIASFGVIFNFKSMARQVFFYMLVAISLLSGAFFIIFLVRKRKLDTQALREENTPSRAWAKGSKNGKNFSVRFLNRRPLAS